MLVAVVLLVLPLLPQRLDPPERVCHPGERVVVRAIDREGKPQAGIAIEVRTPTGESRPVGSTDDAGAVGFTPETAGRFEFRGTFPSGVSVIAVYHVVEEPRRWLWAVVLAPIGLLLVYSNLKKWRRVPA